VSGGFLLQEADRLDLRAEALRVVTRRSPSPRRAALRFAWRVAKYVKSNAIVLATEHATVGIGAGQNEPRGCGTAGPSEGAGTHPGDGPGLRRLLPFRDGVDVAAEAGVTAIIQPEDRCGMPRC